MPVMFRAFNINADWSNRHRAVRTQALLAAAIGDLVLHNGAALPEWTLPAAPLPPPSVVCVTELGVRAPNKIRAALGDNFDVAQGRVGYDTTALLWDTRRWRRTDRAPVVCGEGKHVCVELESTNRRGPRKRMALVGVHWPYKSTRLRQRAHRATAALVENATRDWEIDSVELVGDFNAPAARVQRALGVPGDALAFGDGIDHLVSTYGAPWRSQFAYHGPYFTHAPQRATHVFEE